MKEIIAPVNIGILEKELTADKIIRPTQNGSNIIYIITAQDSPNVLLEIGRLRELSFRSAGGGSGEEVDLDEDDYAPDGYKQLIVWDPENKRIIGGYRYIVSTSENPAHFSTEHYFNFSDRFRKEYLPYTIELGRSFVQPCYQSRLGGKKSLYALDNLWDGLGSIAVMNPHTKYYFGKVTMYDGYENMARLHLFDFFQKYFFDKENLVTPVEQKIYELKESDEFKSIITGNDYNSDYKATVSKLREYDENIPPMINAYMKLSPSMKLFGTVVNEEFGSVQETAMLVTIQDIYLDKYTRYFDSARTHL